KAGVGLIEGEGYIELLKGWDEENRAERRRREAEEEREKGGKGASPKVEASSAAGGNPVGDRRNAEAQAHIELAAPVTRDKDLPEPDPLKEAEKEKAFLITLEQSVELGLINSREYQSKKEDLYLSSLPVTLERFAFAPQFFALGQALYERNGAESPTGL